MVELSVAEISRDGVRGSTSPKWGESRVRVLYIDERKENLLKVWRMKKQDKTN